MSKLAELRQARAARVQEMRALLDKADTERRDLAPEEQTRFDALKGEVTSLEQRIAQREAIDELDRTAPAVPGAGGEAPIQSWGEQTIASPELRAFVAGGGRGRARIELRAITTAGGVGTTDRRPEIIAIPTRRLVVRDLLTVVPTTATSVEVVRETAFTNNAAPVIEATGAAGVGVKPESDIALAPYSVPTRVIAHMLTVSRQALDDLPQLRGYIDGRMRRGLALAEEAQLLSGNGISPNIAGLIGAATAYDTARNVAGDRRTDVVHHAVSQLAEAGVETTGIVLNLGDYLRMLEQKDADGRYLGPGPFQNPGAPTLWGRPVAATPAMAPGSFLVGDFQAQTLFERLAAEVLISSEHADFFSRNLLAVRAEERVALAINVPAALVYGTFGTITA